MDFADEIREAFEAQPCIHHWDIEPPMDATSRGICLKCGEAKTFVNHDGRVQTEAIPPHKPSMYVRGGKYS